MTKKLFYGIFLLSSLFSSAQTLDTTFGVNGFNFTNPSTVLDKSGDFLIEPDNSMVVLGNVGPGSKRAIYKVNSSGNLDTSFGTAGVQITQNQSAHYKVIKLISGKYLTIGSVGHTYNQNFFIERFNADGTLDATFGTGGGLAVNMGYPADVETIDVAYSAVELSDGKIIVCGGAEYGYPKRRACLLKLNQDGSADTSFGTNGRLYLALNTGVSQERVNALSILVANNKLIIAGIGRITDTTDNVNGRSDVYVVRLNMNGTIDTTFGTNGKLIFNFGNPFEFGNIVQDPNGNFYIVGSAFNNGIRDSWVAKINSDGQFVNSFGTAGIVKRKVVNIPNVTSEVPNSILLGDNGIYVGGTFYFTGSYLDYDWMFLTKFNYDGTPDLSFGTNGLFRLPTSNSVRRLSAMKFDSSRKILISGDSTHDDRQFALARITINNESLNIGEASKKEELSFYPNPVTDFLFINVNSESTPVNLSLYGMDGKLIKNLESIRQGDKLKIDLRNCVSGTYLIHMKYNKKDQTLKIIKK